MKVNDFGSRVSKETIYEQYECSVAKPKEYEKITKRKMLQEINDYYKNNVEEFIELLDVKTLKLIQNNLNEEDFSIPVSSNEIFRLHFYNMYGTGKNYIFEELRETIEKVRETTIDFNLKEKIDGAVGLIEELTRIYFYIEKNRLIDLAIKYIRMKKEKIKQIIENNGKLKKVIMPVENKTGVVYFVNLDIAEELIELDLQHQTIELIEQYEGKYKVFSKKELLKKIDEKSEFDFSKIDIILKSPHIYFPVACGINPISILKNKELGVVYMPPAFTDEEIFNCLAAIPIFILGGHNYFEFTNTKPVTEVYLYKPGEIVYWKNKGIGYILEAKNKQYVIKINEEEHKVFHKGFVTEVFASFEQINLKNKPVLPKETARLFYDTYFDFMTYINYKRICEISPKEMNEIVYDVADPIKFALIMQVYENERSLLNSFILESKKNFTEEELLVLKAIEYRRHGKLKIVEKSKEGVIVHDCNLGITFPLVGINVPSNEILKNVKTGSIVEGYYVIYKGISVIEFFTNLSSDMMKEIRNSFFKKSLC